MAKVCSSSIFLCLQVLCLVMAIDASILGIYKRNENEVHCPVRNCTDYIEHTRPPLFPPAIDPLDKKFQIICGISNEAVPCINDLRNQCDGTKAYASAGTFQALLQYICHEGYKEFLAHYDCWSNSYWQYRMGVCHNLAPDVTCSDLDGLMTCASEVTSQECGLITGEYIQRVFQRGRDFFQDFLKCWFKYMKNMIWKITTVLCIVSFVSSVNGGIWHGVVLSPVVPVTHVIPVMPVIVRPFYAPYGYGLFGMGFGAQQRNRFGYNMINQFNSGFDQNMPDPWGNGPTPNDLLPNTFENNQNVMSPPNGNQIGILNAPIGPTNPGLPNLGPPNTFPNIPVPNANDAYPDLVMPKPGFIDLTDKVLRGDAAVV